MSGAVGPGRASGAASGRRIIYGVILAGPEGGEAEAEADTAAQLRAQSSAAPPAEASPG